MNSIMRINLEGARVMEEVKEGHLKTVGVTKGEYQVT